MYCRNKSSQCRCYLPHHHNQKDCNDIFYQLKIYQNGILYNQSPLNLYIINMFYDIDYTIILLYHNILLCNYKKLFVKLFFEKGHINCINSIWNLNSLSMNNGNQGILNLPYHHMQMDCMGIYYQLKIYQNGISYNQSPLNHYIINRFYDIDYTFQFLYHNIHLYNYIKWFLELYFQQHYTNYINYFWNLHNLSKNNGSQGILNLPYHHKQKDCISIYYQLKFY